MKKRIAGIVAMTIFVAFILGSLGLFVWAAGKEPMMWIVIGIIGLLALAGILLEYSKSKDTRSAK